MYGKRLIQTINQNKKEVVTFSIVVYLTYLTRTYIFTTVVVTGLSMTPTINENSKKSVVLVDLLTPARKLKQNDIVLCHDPEESGKYIIKRISGLAGQFIDIDQTRPGKHSLQNAYDSKLIVPSGCCWVEGDNKVKSHDSRHFGPIPLGLLIGRVMFTLWQWPLHNNNVFDKNEILITLGGTF